ncbi:AAA-ATPase-like domain-containing protein [Jimgerdemannia flammicorona]|uniref:AAA-ATPase-like domain-containing protein n=1 Tax=Jimgerdemannia flammicorona TaxID=994334 RepID=A0A433CXY7_9FUNG|nr:AAA-ATPase-like domain-containing protein [Jimgerdemannia flammicorona]
MGSQKIEKCFITGVTPLSMADNTSGFNISRNVSDDPTLSGLCGLSREDVLAALKLRDVCGLNDEEVKKRFDEMELYFNGYRFTPVAETPRVYNTNTGLEYLQVSSQ